MQTHSDVLLAAVSYKFLFDSPFDRQYDPPASERCRKLFEH